MVQPYRIALHTQGFLLFVVCRACTRGTIPCATYVHVIYAYMYMCRHFKHRHVFSVAFSILLLRISEMFFSVRVDFHPFDVFKQDLNKNLLESGLPLSSRQHKQVNKKHVLHCPFLYYTCAFIYISVLSLKEGHIHICDFNERRAYKFTCCRPI